ncbi:hypothetical protein EYZ11_006026 [Aspergillus tanneri]|uniref:CENP-S associating centromere protein X-domain-containing protein n=1 Tax=Aspergillus tanneri TaxID=1220188 RepID=A0A4S3JGK8_9EURO|nr:hypothetical protein EYZ11_006026 [Aspergillus tanneri]
MPPAKRQPQNLRQQPFKVPRRQTSPVAGPSQPAGAAGLSTKPKSKPTAKSQQKKPSASSSKTSRPSKITSKDKRLVSESPETDDQSESGSDSISNSSSLSRERSISEEPDYILAEITHAEQPDDVTTSDPTIPSKLLTRLLHSHFQNGKTKIAKDANAVVAKYVDVFVREALARAAYERVEATGGGGSIGDGFLEVWDTDM